jgi:hypothetical protein
MIITESEDSRKSALPSDGKIRRQGTFFGTSGVAWNQRGRGLENCAEIRDEGSARVSGFSQYHVKRVKSCKIIQSVHFQIQY